ncbi:MmcQ/YjbR family DNA-binding protein [Phenylobacterium sp.]|uniref:MmcQ/YjbR family DNA-binding protein n=1 Tax=Phenylobacterium sp. TaxID=1871053 RepID=UPI0025FD9922|nr:MmcQ/YjbR family DNA-binding protein [Phenylobacterium sp.]
MTREELHAACLALPGVHMDVQWGDDHVYKVAGKMFAATDAAYSKLSFKATDIAFEALVQEGRATPAAYLARAKWVTLDDLGAQDAAEVAGWIRTAHSLVAAKLTRAQKAGIGL